MNALQVKAVLDRFVTVGIQQSVTYEVKGNVVNISCKVTADRHCIVERALISTAQKPDRQFVIDETCRALGVATSRLMNVLNLSYGIDADDLERIYADPDEGYGELHL